MRHDAVDAVAWNPNGRSSTAGRLPSWRPAVGLALLCAGLLGPVPARAQNPSDNADLSGLALSTGGDTVRLLNRTFDASVTSYLAAVGNRDTDLTVAPTTADANATVEYLDGDDNAITDTNTGTAALNTTLDIGGNVIKVKVTAEDDSTTKTYTVQVNRAAAAPTAACDALWCANVTLGDDQDGRFGFGGQGFIDGGSVAPSTFRLGGDLYRIVDFSYEPGSGDVALEVDRDFPAGAYRVEIGGTAFALTRSGPSLTGLFSRTLTETLPKTYGDVVLVKLFRTDILRGLALSSGGTSVGLDRTFESGRTEYRAAVPNASTALTVTPTTISGQTIEYLDGNDTALVDMNTGTPALDTTLAVGRNVIKVKLTAGGRTRTYTVTVARAAVAPTAACDALWCANLTAGVDIAQDVRTDRDYGYSDSAYFGDALAPDEFTHESVTYTVERLYWTRTGVDIVSMSLDRNLRPAGTYSIDIGDDTFEFTASGSQRTFSAFIIEEGVPESYGEVVPVKLKLVEERPNTPATGKPSISGTATVGHALTASTSGIEDSDGLTNVRYEYQWIRVDGSDETDITDATSATYTLTDDDEGKKIKVRVSFTDDAGKREGPLTSDAYPSSGTVLEKPSNTPATGKPSISGTATVGHTLTASTSDIEDGNGLTNVRYEYQWIRVDGSDETDITDATSATYTLTDDDEGKKIKVRVSFTDDLGYDEGPLTSDAYPSSGTVLEKPSNTPATGKPSISGTARVDHVLRAETRDIEDVDGLANVSYEYQWVLVDGSDETDIEDATSVTYRLTEDDEGKKIKVRVSFTDDLGYDEGPLTSDAYPSSGTVLERGNRPATGRPSIYGTPRVGHVLKALTGAIRDRDGLTNVSYQYQWVIRVDGSDETDIAGATSVTYTPTDDDEGKKIRVKVSFTDDLGYDEGPLISEVYLAPTVEPAGGATPPATQVFRVDEDWALKPSGLAVGDRFRLLFATSGGRDATATDISDYNVFVQRVAAAGHSAIQDFSQDFRVLGSTSRVDARDNTGTTGAGVPIYWLGGSKVADNYGDLYDGSWDNETAPRNQHGEGRALSGSADRPFTGSRNNGTADGSAALGAGTVRTGRLNSPFGNPLHGGEKKSHRNIRPFYALSPVFRVTRSTTAAPERVNEFLSRPRGRRAIDLSWGRTGRATGYRVAWSTGEHGRPSWPPDGASETRIDGGDTTKHTITGLAENTAYTVWVTGTNATNDESGQSLLDERAGYSPWSATETTMPDRNPPVPVSACRSTDGRAVTIVFNEALGNSLDTPLEELPRSTTGPDTSSFTVKVAGETRRITRQGAWRGSQETTFYPGDPEYGFVLTFASIATTQEPALITESVTVSYTDPTPGNDRRAVQDLAGQDARSFRDYDAPNVCGASEGRQSPPSTVSPLTALLESGPESHDGETPFNVWIGFSETLDNTELDGDVVLVTGGTNTGSQRVEEDGEVWEIEITPAGTGDVTVELTASDTCGPGIACTTDQRPLSEDFTLTVTGPGEEPPLTGELFDSPVAHDGSGTFEIQILFSERLTVNKDKFRRPFEVTNGAVERTLRADQQPEGGRDLWRVIVEPDGIEAVTIKLPGNKSTCGQGGRPCAKTADGGRKLLSHDITVTVRGPAGLSVANAEATEGTDADMTFTVSLDRSVSRTITVDYATADGTATAGADYTSTSGTLTFTVGGSRTKTVRVPIVDDSDDDDGKTFTLTLSNATNGHIKDGTATGTIKDGDGSPRSPESLLPLTASLKSKPETHDGETAFDVRIRFSERLKNGRLGAKVVRVTGGTNTGSMRVGGDGEEVWEIEITPSGTGDVKVALVASDTCGSGIACTMDQRPLSEDFSLTIEEEQPQSLPPLTASLESKPETHDGETAFDVRIRFSERLKNGKLGAKVVPVTGGTNTGSERVGGDGEEVWEIAITPSGTGDVKVALVASDTCGSGIACTTDLRPLSEDLTFTVIEDKPLTGEVSDSPVAHDGSGTFEIQILFSERLTVSQDKFRRPFEVTNGEVQRTLRADPQPGDGSDLWRVVVEPDGTEAVTIKLPGNKGFCGRGGRPCAKTADGKGRKLLSHDISVTVQGPAGLSVADAEATEGEDADMTFTVSLDRSALRTITVNYATADGTATAGADYTSTSGTLTFTVGGSRTQTVQVPILDDSHDDDGETFTLTLSNVTNGHIKDGTATGTIENRDPLPRALLARFGRTAAVHVVEHVEERMAARREPGFEGRVAGRELRQDMGREMALGLLQRLGGLAGVHPAGAGSGLPGGGAGSFGAPGLAGGTGLGLAGPAGPMGAAAGAGGLSGPTMGAATAGPMMSSAGLAGPMSVTAGPGGGLNGIGFLELGGLGGDPLTGSDFALNRESRGGILSFWSRGSQSHFAGREGTLALGGDVRTTMLGADYARGPMVAGLSLSRSRGLGEYAGVSGGEVLSSVTGLYPWLGYRATERITVWGVGGYGGGGLLLTPQDGAALESALSMKMAAAGTRGELVGGGVSGFGLAFKADALWVGTSIDGVDGPEGRLTATGAVVTRLRTGLEGSRAYALAGRMSVTPSVEVGLRHDGGDAETGAGMDVGVSLVVSDSSTGLAVDVRVRTLLVHQADGFRERGMALSLSYNPTPSTPLGLMARVAPSWGGQATSGAEALWGRETMGNLAHGGVPQSSRLDGEVGYGLAVGKRLVGTPRVGFGASEHDRDYRVGYGLGVMSPGTVRLDLGVDALWRESPMQDGASRGLLGRVSLGW